MAELPFHLKTIEPLPGALDILRYFGGLDTTTASADDICDDLDLSDRRFSKAIRRLVTKGYVQMDGEMGYRLTDQGRGAVEELATYDAEGGDDAADGGRDEVEGVERYMTLAVPQPLIANRPTSIVVGIYEAEDGQTLEETADMVVRLSVLNGEPQNPEDEVFQLTDAAAHRTFTVTPGAFTKMRIKVQVFQLGDNPGDIDLVGGMYVDEDVAASVGDPPQIFGYGTTLSLTP
jgi:DNA-binding MarR family transcriptional regulator